jgi:hypothetical protein
VACALASLVGCQEQKEKPPPVTCQGRCGLVRPPVIGTAPPPGSDAGAGGESGGSDEAVRLTGDVLFLHDLSGLGASVLSEPADLLVEGPTQDVTGRFDGVDPFSLDGVKRASTAWALATPGAGNAIATLQPVDTSRPNDDDVVDTSLTVMSESELDAAYAVISLPVDRDEMLAQLVLVVRNDKRPAAGVRVTAQAAESVIYADNGGFSDTVTATDPTGIVLLANVPASEWPGSGVTVTVTGTVAGRWDLRVVSGAVTFAGIGD